ncbi:MAG TPA: 1,4-dihydroxy-2-naphthoate octaprenyltransferase, partial [Bacteroidales bacterium]|nr:1,4-dihydroxy-2-naphthoate octaprenyltransferase [Bacteroidales bacterium]
TDNNNRIGPQRVTQSGMVTKSAMKRMIGVFVGLALFSGTALIYFGLHQLSFSISLIFFIIGISAIYAAIKYTVGKNPYGYIGLGDIFVYLFFGLIGVCGTFYLHTGYIDPWIIMPASTIGLFSSGVLNLNNLRDVDNDAKCGKRTLVVRIGVRAAKLYHLALVIFAILLSITYTIVFFKSPVQLLFMLTLPLLLSDVKKVMLNTVPIELNNELKKLALTTFAFSITFGLGLILQ